MTETMAADRQLASIEGACVHDRVGQGITTTALMRAAVLSVLLAPCGALASEMQPQALHPTLATATGARVSSTRLPVPSGIAATDLERRPAGLRKGIRADLSWVFAAGRADYLSTEWALSRCTDCGEGNPLLRRSGSRAALKLAGAAAVVWTCKELRRSGHGRAASVLRWAAVAGWTSAAVNNAARGR
jgi:hypothetical protein